MGETGLRTPTKVRKWEEQVFVPLRKLENGRNRSSYPYESSKMGGTGLRTLTKVPKMGGTGLRTPTKAHSGADSMRDYTLMTSPSCAKMVLGKMVFASLSSTSSLS